MIIKLFSILSLVGGLNFTPMDTDQTGINIVTLCQDKQGCIWFGGKDGATRYDGSRFLALKPNDTDGAGIYENQIKQIICDSKGLVWVAHISGITCYNPSGELIKDYPIHNEIVSDIAELSSGRFLTIVGNRLSVFDAGKETFSSKDIPASLSQLPVRSLHDGGDSVFIGSVDGRIAVVTKDFSSARILPVNMGSYRVNCILKDTSGHLWAGTEGNGLWEVSTSDWSSFRSGKATFGTDLEKSYVRALCLDEAGGLWIGTKNGLFVHDGEGTAHYHYDYYNPDSITHNSVYAIKRDIQGTMWIGTYFGGVCYHTPNVSNFEKILSKPGPESLNGNIISDIAEDSDGSLWIGTNSGSLNHLRADGVIEHIQSTAQNSSDPVDIKCIYVSKTSGDIFIGADFSGLSVVDRRNGRLTSLSGDSPIDIYAIEDNGHGGFYIGATSGLFEYDEKTRHLSRIMVTENLQNIKSLKRDSRGVLWIGKKTGVSALDLNSGQFVSLPEEMKDIWYVEDFLESSGGAIWISSCNGLYRYAPGEGTMLAFSEKDGLPSNVIHGVEEDSDGRLWISTNAGLCRMDPSSGDKLLFTTADGLPANRFSSYAHCRTSDGMMYFGGLQWIIRFNPASIKLTNAPVAPIISSVNANGETRHPEDGWITLKPDERNFVINFSAPDFISGENGRFYYKMDGVDDGWNEAGADRTAVYHKLKHGKYTFRLKYRNSSGIEYPEECTLHLKMQPHWYETTAFIVVLCLIVVLGVFYLMRRELKRNKTAYKSELDRVRNELLHDFSLEFMRAGKNSPAADNADASRKFGRNDEEFMRKAMQIVKDNIGNIDFSVDSLAKDMNMSRSNLHLRTKSLFGVPPLEFIKTVRFNEACRLLKENKHSVSEIGYMTGFASPSYFASAFHKFIGCSPSEYLSRHEDDASNA